jgi:hypothetical protein
MALQGGSSESQVLYVVETGLHSGGQAMIIYSGSHERRTLRTSRIGSSGLSRDMVQSLQ